jgi:hypothetical protein
MSIVIFRGNESQLAIPPNGKIGRAKRLAISCAFALSGFEYDNDGSMGSVP